MPTHFAQSHAPLPRSRRDQISSNTTGLLVIQRYPHGAAGRGPLPLDEISGELLGHPRARRGRGRPGPWRDRGAALAAAAYGVLVRADRPLDVKMIAHRAPRELVAGVAPVNSAQDECSRWPFSALLDAFFTYSLASEVHAV